MTHPTIGVLALQGDYERHVDHLARLQVPSRLVKLPRDLEGLAGIILPGGESTTMSILLDKHKLREPFAAFCASKPVYATCAGMILLAKTIVDNQAGVKSLGLLDIDIIRNGYGRQVFSFEANLPISNANGLSSVKAWFIRAPKVARVGKEVTVLSSFENTPVLLRQNKILAASFHAELGDDTGVVSYFLKHFFLA